MKKSILRLSSIILLVFSILFGGLITFTPVFADYNLTKEDLDSLFGTIPDSGESNNETPSSENAETPSSNNGGSGLTEEDLDSLFGSKDDTGENNGNNNSGNLTDEDLDSLFGEGNSGLTDEDLDSLFGEGNSGLTDEDLDSLFGKGDDDVVNTCQDEGKGASWVLCTAFEVASSASDTLYGIIEDFLVIDPLTTDTDSAVHRVWDYMRGVTNILFIIFLTIVIYSQITGLGINNYGIKRILPRLIIAVILVNLSYIICAGLVDISNIIGSSISGTFDIIITETGLTEIAENALRSVNWGQIYLALTGSAAALSVFVVSQGGLKAAFWMALLLIFGVVLSIFSGLLTIGLRQVVVVLLVAISPLAFIAYLLPNTEKWFEKWKALLAQMIFFYPIFAILFYSSKLGGLTIMASAINDEGKANILKVIIGLTVQVLPLLLSISLFKMSGTILGKVSAGLDKAFGHLQKPAQGWALSHAEQNRQRYLSNNNAPGAKLRNFLMKKQLLREMNTLDNKENVINRATEAALNQRASYLGLDENGNPIWGTRIGRYKRLNHASRYTIAAARAHSQKLAATAAQARLANSLSDHGSLFEGEKSEEIAKKSANAFENLAIQEFWKENIAQNDQEYLIGKYLGAIAERGAGNDYNYNRFIMGAAGSFGYKGEKTIVAQVVKRSADIEAKRRAEAAIVINKFGYSKEFRNMMLDRRYLNDNGFALDADGEIVEDENYQPLPGKTVEKWHKYIYVDKRNKEISRETGDAMTEDQLKAKGIRKIRYCDITDDDGNVVSHVYEDDAGYVKEMIMNDMLISDPIARRYATELGLPIPKQKLMNDPVASQFAEENAKRGKGEDRRYTSSYVGAYQASGYNEHNAAFTSMLLAQLRGGNVNSNGQLSLAEMMSFNASGKVGKFLLNDGVYYDNFRRMLSSFNNPEMFEQCMQDADVALYLNQNSEFLDGLRLGLDKNGNPTWIKINSNSPDITLDDKKNYIWHKVFPKYVQKVIGALGRKPSPNVFDNMKPENVKPLINLLDFVKELAEQNADPSIPFEKRLDGNIDLFEDTDPNLFKYSVDEGRRRAEARKQGLNPNTVNHQQQYLRNFVKRARQSDPHLIEQSIEELINDNDISDKSAYDLLRTYCHNNPILRDRSVEIDNMIELYRFGGPVGDDEEQVARNFASNNYTREQFFEEFRERFL